MRNDKENLIVSLTLQFALDIVVFTEKLEEMKKFVVARQILKSGTSIGANVREAQNAESKADFIHKLKIAAKEADETGYWLEICRHSQNYCFDPELTEQLISITKVLSKIIGSSKRRQSPNQHINESSN
ncbi:MAG: four helix bundle protein [Reichenbachiella sp.]|uniref:four helix bundle protein n=1 Tax=Reichenbachiella sp. TaxID=2184521 RepID=UPI0032662AFE